MIVLRFIQGICMALADSVPGVSGGTVAFLLGFYDDFINSLHDIFSRDKMLRKKAFTFLIKIGIGWIFGFISAVLILTKVFESHIYEVSSLFMGFVILSIPIIIKEEKENIAGHYKNIIFLLIGMAIVFAVTFFNSSSQNGAEISFDGFNPGGALYVFFAGMIAISAMVLPGISGSTLLLIFGIYLPVITAVEEILHFNFSSLPNVIAFGLGILCGIVLIVNLLRKALKKYRSAMIYFIIGLMAASVYSIILGPQTLSEPLPAMSFENFNILFFLMGGVFVGGMQLLKSISEKKQR